MAPLPPPYPPLPPRPGNPGRVCSQRPVPRSPPWRKMCEDFNRPRQAGKGGTFGFARAWCARGARGASKCADACVFFCIFFSGRVEGCCMMVFWGGIFLPGGGLGKAEKDLWFGTPARARIVCEELPIKRCGKGRLESHLWCQTDFSRVNPQMT